MEISINVASLMLSVMLISSEDAMATVTMTQSNSEVIVGGTTHMSCVTSIPKEVYWRHFPAGGPAHEQKEIYTYGKMHSPYKDRCEMKINRTTGVYQLVIPRVELTDAGVYTCQEDEGFGASAQAQLTVIESGPTCTSTKNPIELIGPNSCNKGQENLTLACSVAYRGNIQPMLEWKMVGSNDTVTQGLHVEKTENRITSHLTMSSQPALDGLSYRCQTTKTKYNCTSDVINIIYVTSSNFTQKATIGDTIVCTANTNESCSYRWKWFKGDDVLTASNYQILIPKQSGNFRCEAECIIRKEPCTITAMYAYVEDGNATLATGNVELGSGYSALFAVVVVVTVCVVIIILLFLLLLYLFRKRCLTKSILGNVQNVGLLMEDTNGMVKDINKIPKHCTPKLYISKGSSGEIYGPFIFRDIKCVCERIMLTLEKVSSATEFEVCGPGRRWMELDHSNVLKFYNVLFQPPVLYVVMEYAEGGTVRKALNSCTADLEISVVKDWAMQIAVGMNYLHSKEIVHGHIKAAQILIMEPFDPTNLSPKTLKIASYRLTMDHAQSAAVSFQGMFGWMSPEAIKGERICKASDVYSYGVTVWEILTKAIPYQGVKQSVLIKDLSKGRTLSVPSQCPNALCDILNECWEQDMDKRPTFPHIVSRLHAVADC